MKKEKQTQKYKQQKSKHVCKSEIKQKKKHYINTLNAIRYYTYNVS